MNILKPKETLLKDLIELEDLVENTKSIYKIKNKIIQNIENQNRIK